MDSEVRKRVQAFSDMLRIFGSTSYQGRVLEQGDLDSFLTALDASADNYANLLADTDGEIRGLKTVLRPAPSPDVAGLVEEIESYLEAYPLTVADQLLKRAAAAFRTTSPQPVSVPSVEEMAQAAAMALSRAHGHFDDSRTYSAGWKPMWTLYEDDARTAAQAIAALLPKPNSTGSAATAGDISDQFADAMAERFMQPRGGQEVMPLPSPPPGEAQ